MRGVEEGDSILNKFWGCNQIQIRGRMQLEERKRKRRCQGDCRDHVFSLQTFRSTPSKYDIKVQFCPKYQRDPLPPQQTFPEFNHDLKYYTSAFLLGVDKRMLQKNEQQEIMDHQKQIRDSLEKHNQLVFPRPASKHTFCSVCKDHYRNYYFHIGSEDHRERVGVSAYNNHIKDLCYLYLDLWDGCEHRADLEDQRLATLEEERRQRIADFSVQSDSNSLADCQRGSREQRVDSYGNALPHKSKAIRKASRNDETLPLQRKRSVLSSYQPMRKQMFGTQSTSIHGARERKERNYQRQRMKAMRGTEFEKYNREFIPLEGHDSDAFTILRSAHPAERNSQIPAKVETLAKKMAEESPHKSLSQLVVAVEEEQSSSVASDEKIEEENAVVQKAESVEEGELSRSDSDNSDGFFSRRTEKKRTSPPRLKGLPQQRQQQQQQQSYNYPYRIPMPPPHYPPPQCRPGDTVKTEADRLKEDRAYRQMHPDRPKQQEGYAPPNYYYPYPYPPVYDHQYAMPPDKDRPAAEASKGKEKEKQQPYDYMRYPWPYPYYGPPQPAVQAGSEEGRQSAGSQEGQKDNSYVGNTNTNININYPTIYMYPQGPYNMRPSHYPMPHHSMMNPYGYQYNPYPPADPKADPEHRPQNEGSQPGKPTPFNGPPQHTVPQQHAAPPSGVSQHGFPTSAPNSGPGPASGPGAGKPGVGRPGYYPPPYGMQYHPGYMQGPPKPPPNPPKKSPDNS